METSTARFPGQPTGAHTGGVQRDPALPNTREGLVSDDPDAAVRRTVSCEDACRQA